MFKVIAKNFHKIRKIFFTVEKYLHLTLVKLINIFNTNIALISTNVYKINNK